ncbi:MAG: fasciclin domain-containing protein [Bacteroidota bacterium]
MKTIPLFKKIAFFFLVALAFNSCSNNDDDGGTTTDRTGDNNDTNSLPNIVELADTVDILTTLLDAVEAAGGDLGNTLATGDPLTVFAPSNDAFNALLAQLDGFDSLDDFDEAAEKEILTKILQYHVVADTKAFSSDLSDGQSLPTVQSENLTVTVDGAVFINDKTDEAAEVVGADNEASNGIVHIIDKVLLPQEVLDILFPKPTIVELVVETEELSQLEEAVIKAGLVDALNGEGPFTVFAPTNAAIDELFELLGDSFNSFDDFDNFIEIQILEDILTYHVVPGNIAAADLSAGNVNTLLEGETLEIISSGETFVIGDASEVDANIENADNFASNGVIHIIDKILIPQEVQDFLDTLNPDDTSGGAPTIKEIVESTEELDFLREALELTGLLETLGEEGPFTVFAPTGESVNIIFGLLGTGINSLEDIDLSFEIDLLRQVLSYHVVPGAITSSDLMQGPVPTLLEGDGFTVIADGAGFVLQDGLAGLDANLLLTDIPASNGVIHTIDRILVPETVIYQVLTETEQSLMALLEELEDNEVFMTAYLLVRDSLEDVLNGDAFTFFLPTNQAFLELFAQLDGIHDLTDFDTEAELRLLGKILVYHCVDGVKGTSDILFNGQELTTVQGETLIVQVGDEINILDKTTIPAKVTSPDFEVLNGVLHIINKVLLPQEVLTQLSS